MWHDYMVNIFAAKVRVVKHAGHHLHMLPVIAALLSLLGVSTTMLT